MLEKIIKGIATGAVLLGSMALGGCFNYSQWYAEHKGEFGTIENSTYFLKDIPKETDLDSLAKLNFPKSAISKQELQKIEKDLEQGENLYSKFKKTSPKNPSEAEKFVSDVSKYQETYRDIFEDLVVVSLNWNEPDPVKINESDLKRDISEADFSKRIFEYMTGKPFPDNFVEIIKGNLPKTKIFYSGYHQPTKEKIYYRDIEYARNISILFHEQGHACAQHMEETIGKSKKKTDELRLLEEACAYAFTDAGAHAVYKEDKELGKILKNYFEFRMREGVLDLYEDAVEDLYSPEHAKGEELFLATRHVLKNPSEVFNYLATLKDSDLDNLDPRIKQQIRISREFGREKSKVYELQMRARELYDNFSKLKHKAQRYLKSK